MRFAIFIELVTLEAARAPKTRKIAGQIAITPVFLRTYECFHQQQKQPDYPNS